MLNTYAPLPIADYHLQGVPFDFVDMISHQSAATEMWNLYWLSIPQVDFIPGSGSNWMRRYKGIHTDALSKIVLDVKEDNVLRAMLRQPPATFLTWWRNDDHTIYDTYDVLDGEAWVETVASRAALAASRFSDNDPVKVVQGNVFHVNFGRRA